MERKVVLGLIVLAGLFVLGYNLFNIKTNATEDTFVQLIPDSVATEEANKIEEVKQYKLTRVPGEVINNLDMATDQLLALNLLKATNEYKVIAKEVKDMKYLAEVFAIADPAAGDIDQATCPASACKRIEIYNFSTNQTLIAYINNKQKQPISIVVRNDIMPEVPEHLKDIAIKLAAGSAEVKSLNEKYGATAQVTMPATKTDLKDSRCERQRDLCVAPTYAAKTGAVWAIVDLTELKVAAAAWTRFSKTDNINTVDPLTLRRAEKNKIEEFCKNSTTVDRDGWKFDYQLTSSDGLLASGITYQGTKLINSVKLVDWHVSYSGDKKFGYSDAAGCPSFSQSAVVAADLPKVEDFEDSLGSGFALIQDFWSDGYPGFCNYFYRQIYKFYNDGSFRPIAESRGTGCGDNATYRPTTRIALSPTLSNFSDPASEEFVKVNAENNRFKLGDGYTLISPVNGDWSDQERGDNAYVYFTKGDLPNEGGDDTPTLGPCCNTDEKQGPEKFINGESLADSEVTLWYVPQIMNSFTPGSEFCYAKTYYDEGQRKIKVWPCDSGPLLRSGDV